MPYLRKCFFLPEVGARSGSWASRKRP